MIFAQSVTNKTPINVLLIVLILVCTSTGIKAQPLSDGGETTSAESRFYTISVPEQKELSGGHLQGAQLYKETLIVSGSSNRFAYLAIFQLLNDEFRFIGVRKLSSGRFNHAGGFQIAENWLAVGVEDPLGKKRSQIQLIDVSSLEKLSRPPVFTLNRKGEYKRSTAGAVALLKRDGHFLLAVGSWDSTVIDFYTSNHTNPYSEDFEFSLWTSWDSREAKRNNWTDRNYNSYQSLQLTEDSTGVYLTGFARSGDKNLADIFRLDVVTDPYNLVQKVGTYTVQCKADVTFRNSGGFANFNGITSIVAVGHGLTPKTNIQVFPINRR